MYKIVLFFCFYFCYTCAISQTAGFTYQSTKGTFCSPDTIKFTPTSSGNPEGYLWDFGNNRHSHSANPSVIYSGPGSYTVSLLVIYLDTTAQTSQVIVVNPTLNPAFSISTKDICTPGTINFSAAAGANVESYSWNFGDGTPLTATTINNISHPYTNYGNFDVTLVVKSTAGCTSSSSIQTVTVQKPGISATVSATEGCIPLPLTFNATVSLLPNDAVRSYMWNYGDGSPVTTTAIANTSHTYTTTGRYSPTLSIVTAGGCTSTYNYDSIYLGIPPTNLIAYTQKSTICGSETAVFIGKATNANSYTWDNSETIDSLIDTISKHKYRSLGTKKVLVTPFFNGCAGKSDSFNISVIGVISNFFFTNDCTNKKNFSFVNYSLGNLSSITWDLGDGSPLQNSRNVFGYTYADSGFYRVSLTVFDNTTGCADIAIKPVSIAFPVLSNPDQFVCKNSTTTFTVSSVYPNITSKYIWYVIGQRPGLGTDPMLMVKGTTFGTYDDTVIIDNGGSYCRDTIFLNHKITVKGPIAGFTSRDSICLSIPLTVVDTSKPYLPGDNIVTWDWNFGDGSTHDSTSKPAPHEYSNPGNYLVSLQVTDINGCTDAFKKFVSVSEDAFVYTFPKTDSLCAGLSKTLIAYRNDPGLLWSPANLVSCATCDTVSVMPTKNTTFYATSTNKYGCTATDSVVLKVYLPFTATTATPDFYLCLGESAQLNVSPSGYKIVWSPAAGLSDPNISNPVATPSATTAYRATVSDLVGCFTSSVDVVVHLKTQPGVDAGPDQFFPYNSSFTLSPIYSNNVVSYLWSPPIQLNCTSCASPSGRILQKQTYTVQVTSDSGCVSKDNITIFVECKDSNLLLPNAFTPNNDNLNDVFYPFGRGMQVIKNFSIYNREGHLVFQKKNFPPNDKTFGWNGSFKGESYSTAIFVYVIEAICDSGETVSKKGTVTLIK